MNAETSSPEDPIWDLAWSWVQRLHEAGDADASLREACVAWQRADPAHARAFARATAIWSAAGLVPRQHDDDPSCP